MAPTLNSIALSRPMFTLSALISCGFCAPARISMPTRVLWISPYEPTATSRPTAMIAKRYDG